jgi:hypothetical protein
VRIPNDFPVKPIGPKDYAKDRCTCGTCGLSWDDAIPTTYTPAPSARCPFESFHNAECEHCNGTGCEPSGTSYGGLSEMLECDHCGGTGFVEQGED